MLVVVRRGNRNQPQAAIGPSGRALSAGLSQLTNFSVGLVAPYGPQTWAYGGSGAGGQVVTSAGVGITGAGAGWFTPTGSQAILDPRDGSTSWAMLLQLALNSTGQTNKYAVYADNGGSANQTAVIYGYVANSFEMYAGNFTGTDPRTGSQLVVSDTKPHTIIYSYDNGAYAGYLDGVQIFSVSRTWGSASGAAANARLFDATGGNILNATALTHATFRRGLSADDAIAFSRSPSLLYKPRRIWVPVSAGAGAAALAATPTAVATLTGALTTTIQLAAAPAALATQSGALTTTIQLAAAPAALATITAALTTTPAGIAATPAVLATMTGALTTAIQLAAAPAAVATLTASFAGSAAALAATPTAQATLTGALTTSIQAAAMPAAQVTMTAALTTSVRLASAVIATASATAELTTAIQLTSALSAQALVTADLNVGSQLAAAIIAQAQASAALTTAIRLQAQAAAVASMTATFEPPPAFVEPVLRVLLVLTEDRTLLVPGEDRTMA